jgi:glycine/D-amino acid oxidase-like deaminating enzyme
MAHLTPVSEKKEIVIIGQSTLNLMFCSMFRLIISRLGGGSIGACTAYYITRHPQFDTNLHAITLLEATEVAGGSSGKAGGLLGSWAYPACLAPLSYKLHAELAAEYDGANNWGYRNVICSGCKMVSHDEVEGVHSNSFLSEQSGPQLPPDLDWILPECVESYWQRGDHSNTSQLHPYLFTTSMARQAAAKGATIILGSANQILYSTDGSQVKSVTYTAKGDNAEKVIPATDIVIAAGPWTPTIFHSAPIVGWRSHSIVIKPTRTLSAYVLMPEIQLSHKNKPQEEIKIEIYPRPDDTVYSCGPTDHDVPLPPTSDKVEVDDQRCTDIWNAVTSISKEIHDGELLVKQSCYRPIVDGRPKEVGPLLGETGVRGLWLAAGHASWGMNNGPATGKVLSEMIFEGKARSADISSLDPRLMLKKPLL